MDVRGRYGRWAVVAGASEGLGAAWSRALAARGHDVLLIARREAPLEALAAELRETSGVQTKVVSIDLAGDDVRDRFVAATEGLEIGVLVYNACYSAVGGFLALSDDDVRLTVDVNCRGPLTLVRAVAPDMIARGKGSIVLMSSMSGFQGTAMVGTYAATKAFDTVLAEGLWDELRPHGVHVLGCVAGATTTPGFESVTPERKRASVLPMEPDAVVAEALGALERGPIFVAGFLNRWVYRLTGTLLSRRAAVRFFSGQTRRVYGDPS